MKNVRLLKGLFKTLIVLAVVVGSLFAIYRYVIPQEVTQQIKNAFMNVKNDMGFYEDSGITGEEYTFDTTYYPYYGYLSDDAKTLYKQIYANALALETSFVPVVPITVSEVVNVINAVYHDHPELFWMESGYTYKYTEDNICVHVNLNFNETANNIEEAKTQFEERANAIIDVASALGSDYEKEKYVYKALMECVEYDENAELHQSPYSAMVYGKSVCAGYARAFQYIMLELGVPTYYCTGESQGHAWNIIKLDGGYYNVDVSRADTKSSPERYFNRTDEDLRGTHKRSGYSTILPKCRAKTYEGMED
jgi:transglutaminase/protease-like cytokinesis protein 3